MEVKASLGKKFSRPISTNGWEWWWHTSVIPATWGSTQSRHKVRPYLRNNQIENGWQSGSSCRAPN
jgi:hypothetical protein